MTKSLRPPTAMGAAAPVAPTALLQDDENLARAKALGILQVHDIGIE